MIKRADLPDRFWLGDRWQVAKQGREYYIQDVVEGGEDKTITEWLARYLLALYIGQLYGDDGWISLNDIVSIVVGPSSGDMDGGTNTHNVQLSNLRKIFSKELIENRPQNKIAKSPSSYRLTAKIVPIDDTPPMEKVDKGGESTEEHEKEESIPDDGMNSPPDGQDKAARKSKYYLVKVIGIPTIFFVASASAFLSDVFNIYGFLNKLNEAEEPALSSIPGSSDISSVGYDISLRYSSGDDEKEYIFESGQELHSGDRFRISIRPEKAAYLYIFYLDSSETDHLLFPPSHKGGVPGNYDNPIDAGYTLHLPSQESAYRLDEQVGYESLTVIAVNQPLTQLEELEKISSSSGSIGEDDKPGTLADLNKAKLKKELDELRREFVKVCSDCIKTVDIIHR